MIKTVGMLWTVIIFIFVSKHVVIDKRFGLNQYRLGLGSDSSFSLTCNDIMGTNWPFATEEGQNKGSMLNNSDTLILLVTNS